MSESVMVFASFHPREDSRATFLELMSGLVENTRREPGCVMYDLYEDEDGGFHLFEEYADREALDTHRAADYFTHYRANVVDMIDGDIGVLILSAVDKAG